MLRCSILVARQKQVDRCRALESGEMTLVKFQSLDLRVMQVYLRSMPFIPSSTFGGTPFAGVGGWIVIVAGGFVARCRLILTLIC
jgi:hypothetical protein